MVRIILEGTVVGFVTGIVGAGGGFLVVPALVLLGGLPMQLAVGTSLLVVMMKSTAGFLGYILKFGGDAFVSINPNVSFDWSVVLLVTAFAVVGSFIGAALAGKLHPERLRRAFGWFVMVMAFFILSQQVGSSLMDWARGSVLQATEVIVGLVVIIVGIIVVVRWPAKIEVADFDVSGASESLQEPKPGS